MTEKTLEKKHQMRKTLEKRSADYQTVEESFWLEKIDKLLRKDKLYGVLWFGHFTYAWLVLIKPHDENDKKIGSIWKAIYESYYDLVPADDKELGRVSVAETSRPITLKELHEALDGLVSKMHIEDDVFLHISKPKEKLVA